MEWRIRLNESSTDNYVTARWVVKFNVQTRMRILSAALHHAALVYFVHQYFLLEERWERWFNVGKSGRLRL